MNAPRRTLAFAYGFVLMYLVSVWMAGVMAACAVPREYFAFFAAYGDAGKGLALAMLGVALHVIPSVLLLGLGVALYARLAGQGGRSVGLWVGLGCAVSYGFWLLYGAAKGPVSAAAVLAHVLTAPWWAWPNILAPFLGLGFAALLVSRVAPPTPRALREAPSR